MVTSNSLFAAIEMIESGDPYMRKKGYETINKISRALDILNGVEDHIDYETEEEREVRVISRNKIAEHENA